MPARATIAIFAAALLATPAMLLAQPPPEFSPPKEIAPGIFKVGTVQLDKNAGTVSFPAKVNMNDGLLEYLMVSPQGPVHESLFTSEAAPQDVHMAMLLLGAKGMVQQQAGKEPPRIDAAYLASAPKLTGDRISLTVKWTDKSGKEQVTPPERWIVRRIFTPKKPAKTVTAEDGPWLYTGSFFYENRFIAQVEGAFAAMVTYPGALINNPRTGSNDDQIWFVKTETVPPVGTPVEFIIRLQPADKPAK
ncbi:MAG: YdjY domain-containing protein [Chthoniobacteraceae bacterium]